MASASRFSKDKVLKQSFLAFKEKAFEGMHTGENSFKPRSTGLSFALRKGVFFNLDASFYSIKNDLIQRCIELLGVQYDDPIELENIAWDCALSLEKGEESFKEFSSILVGMLESESKYIMPNYLFELKDVEQLRIGPVEVKTGEKALLDIHVENENIKYEIGPISKFEFKDGLPVQTIKDVSWVVHVRASKHNLEEEAVWLANIAVSLLRFMCWGKLGALCPREGDIEPSPNVQHISAKNGVSLIKDRVYIGGVGAPRVYFITQEVVDILESDDFLIKAKHIFSFKKGNVAERFSRGLGWLSKARQATSNAEKFLFFFTSIEALLSSNSGGAPVVQTISRHFASILSESVEDRYDLAKRIKDLYHLRSQLVHSGVRGVSIKDVKQLQFYAEALFFVVLRDVNLEDSFDSFQSSLNKASYGTVWL